MQVTETNSDGLKREFTITVPRADIVQKLENQLESLKSRIRLPGFRPGKAPLPLLKKLHGKSLMGQVLEETINETSGKTLEERNLRPALQPQIEITKFDLEAESDLEYKMSVEIVPEIKVPDFSEIKLERLVADVPDELVDQEIERLAASRKNFVAAPDGKAAENGDVVVIDFVGKLDGEPFEGGAAEGHSLELGSGSFIPGFEEQLVGVKAGEERVITVTFPENYPAKDLAGKETTFDVKVHEVKVAEPVQVNDDLAKMFGLESLDELKKLLRERIEQDNKEMSRARLKRSLLDVLAEREQFEVPEGMVELEFQQIWRAVLADMGHDPDHVHDEHCNHDHDHDHEEPSEEMKAEYRAIADRRVRLGLLLAEVGQQNKITVPQEEVTRLIAREARRFPGQERQVFEFYQRNPQAMAQLRAPLYEDKVVDFILELVKLEDRKVTREELERAVNEDEAAPEAKPAEKKPAKKAKAKADKAEEKAEAAADAAEAAEKPKKAATKSKAKAADEAEGEAKPKAKKPAAKKSKKDE